jgi:hypothetical protein
MVIKVRRILCWFRIRLKRCMRKVINKKFLSFTTNICLGLFFLLRDITVLYSLWMPLYLPIKRRHHRFLVPASSWPFLPKVWGHIALTEPTKIKLTIIAHTLVLFIFHCKSFHLSPLSRGGILEQHFLSRLLVINSRLLRLELCLLQNIIH